MSKSFIPVKKALLWIFISTFILSGIPWSIYFCFNHLWHLRLKDSKYEIIAMVQTSQNSFLKTDFLAELLNLSKDQRENIYHFDLKLGEKKLLNFPLIKSASIKRIMPGILHIDYTMRNPIGILGEIANTSFDQEGCLFPTLPFFQNQLPTFYLGLDQDELRWGKKIANHPNFKLVLKLLHAIEILFAKEEIDIKNIDVSYVNALSLGERKIVLETNCKMAYETHHKHFVLLDPANVENGLIRYKALIENEELKKMHELIMIDLRLPYLGYIQKYE